MIPLESILRRELERGRIKVNPTHGLKVPRKRREKVKARSADEVAALIAAVPEADRAVWATACYAGLRRGELRALRVDRIDFDAEVIHVERGWDDLEGEQQTKSGKDRKVPLPPTLARELRAHLMRTGRRDSDLVFGVTATSPFVPRRLTDRADAAWKATRLERITLHQGRHAYASLMIDAGTNEKTLCEYMGHSSIVFTHDTYGHLFEHSEKRDAARFDAYLKAGAS